MSKVNIKDLAETLGATADELLKLSDQKVPAELKTGKGKRTWFTEEAVAILRAAIVAPCLVPMRKKGRVVRAAANPSWVYVKLLEENGPVVPMAVPRRLRFKLLNKPVVVEGITDESMEITYRYVSE